eukprot:TRINITY_DN74207_c0_g1_i1.p1 TRINITY_DN74207_c0_g1~~TRINITY_DN74207_c0_g1_i1.p1  ORF type:complete len:287 (-),score=81.91 TRINITY_DN74207_c0_g1_i1:43-903(-)
MGVVDRTDEFRSIIRDLAAKGAVPGFTGLDEAKGSNASSELNMWSAQIGTEIHQAGLRVQELRKMARAKGIFNDKTNEIQTLTFNVKNDIKTLDQKIEALAAKAKGSGPNRSYQAHSSNMVETLKTRLLEVTKDFKDALEDRTKTLEFQDKRRQIWSASNAGPSNPFAQRQQPTPTGNAADLEGGGSGGQAQQVMHHSNRAEAVQNVQKTIGELAQMFQKMAVLVTSQEDMIKRIDSDVDDTLDNVQQAQDHLLKYFHHISSNRMLIIKVFLILLFFVVFFVVFLA